MSVLSSTTSILEDNQPTTIVEFGRKKDFKFIKYLGQGACGQTVLLEDEIINEKFVCKKYTPLHKEHKQTLFQYFVQEIKLLYKVHHHNIVRVFNYYLYPENTTGYIMMEYIQGTDIESFLQKKPENINEIFLQVIDGFAYLERNKILHRDIRVQNIMVTEDGTVKVIDFGFAKSVQKSDDFEKSISLNWWCELPAEFKSKPPVYDFQTEIYFVGKLFEKIIQEKEIEYFKYKQELTSMCQKKSLDRSKSFSNVLQGVLEKQFLAIDFSEEEKQSYKDFSSSLCEVITQIESQSRYVDDVEKIQTNLEALYKRVMLEDYVPQPSDVARYFISGAFKYSTRSEIEVSVLKHFIELLRSCSREKKNIILSNIHSKLSAVKRFDTLLNLDDEIPF